MPTSAPAHSAARPYVSPDWLAGITRGLICRKSLYLSTLFVIIALSAACIVILSAESARAAASEAYSGPKTWNCSKDWGSGSLDADGTLYVSCNGKILTLTRDGRTKTYTISRDYKDDGRVDVAPSPHGDYLYVAGQADIGGKNYVYTLRRWNRVGPQYIQDPNWRPQRLPYGQTTYTPKGRYIATDSSGYIYFSSGAYVGNVPAVVSKYAPDGKWLQNIGDLAPGFASDSSTFTPGLFWSFTVGVAVNRSGSRLYVAESGNGRIQRFDRQASGEYKYARQWGNTYADTPVVCAAGVCERTGSCEEEKFGVPYDLTTDAWGYVYAINTSCERVHKYTPAGDYVGAWYIDDGGVTNSLHDNIAHTLAVDARGNIYLGERNRMLTRLSPWPADFPYTGPTSDTVKPVIDSLTIADLNLQTQTLDSAFRQVGVRVHSRDQGHGLDTNIAGVRMADDGEDIAKKPWRPYKTWLGYTLHGGRGMKTVRVQVRDGAGNISLAERLSISCIPCVNKNGTVEGKWGNNYSNTLSGTFSQNTILARGGADTINASQNDHKVDVIFCGGGYDTARVRWGDIVIGCERVVRL